MGGVRPNPRLSLVHEGISLVKEKQIDFILAIGGGSVIDSAKAIAYGACNEGEIWDYYMKRKQVKGALPVGCIATAAAAGSEMSNSSVITNEEGRLKRGLSSSSGYCRFALLDPALTRPGRFDRKIEVGLPGRRERLSILKLHSRNKPRAGDVNLERLAAETAYFSGASLENLLNEAAIFAAQREDEEITLGDVRAALIRTTVGADRESAATAAEKRVIAVHEAGHAVALRMLTPNSRLTRVSILPAGRGAAGYNLAVPGEKVMLSKADMENQICVLLAGRAAELLAGGDDALTAGAASDLTRAGELAAAMVTELGMAGEPSVSLKALSRVCGGMPGAQEQCRALLQQQFERTQRLMLQHSDALLRLTEALVENESLTGEEVEAVLSSENAESTKAD